MFNIEVKFGILANKKNPKVFRISESQFKVKAAGTYFIGRIGDSLSCNCLSGQYGNCCYHIAAVGQVIIGDRELSTETSEAERVAAKFGLDVSKVSTAANRVSFRSLCPEPSAVRYGGIVVGEGETEDESTEPRRWRKG